MMVGMILPWSASYPSLLNHSADQNSGPLLTEKMVALNNRAFSGQAQYLLHTQT